MPAVVRGGRRQSSAKGGAALGIRQELGVPILFVGTGEALEDLQPFDAEAFAEAFFAAPAAAQENPR